MNAILVLIFASFIGSAFGGFYDVFPLDRGDVSTFLLLVLIVFGGLIIFAVFTACQSQEAKVDYRALLAGIVLFLIVFAGYYYNTVYDTHEAPTANATITIK